MTRCTITWVVSVTICLLSGCTLGLPSWPPNEIATAPIILAAQTAAEQWAREAGLESADPHCKIVHNDGTTATVHVRFMCRECADGIWLGHEGLVSLHRVGGRWQISAPPQFGLAADYQPRILNGHTQCVCCLTYSADGRWLASGSADATINLWDVGTLQIARSLEGDEVQVRGLAFSPTGELLAGGGRDGVILWSIPDGQLVRKLLGHTGGVFAVDFAPDGKSLVSGGEDGRLMLWDVDSGEELPRRCQGGSVIRAVAFSPDGGRIAAGCRAGEARGWDLATWEPLFALHHPDSILDLAFSPDGTLLATAGTNRTAELWDAHTGRHYRKLSLHTDWVTGVAFSPDGDFLATSSRDGTVRLWSVASGRQLRVMEDGGAAVHSIAYTPDGASIAAGSVDGTIRLWRVR